MTNLHSRREHQGVPIPSCLSLIDSHLCGAIQGDKTNSSGVAYTIHDFSKVYVWKIQSLVFFKLIFISFDLLV